MIQSTSTVSGLYRVYTCARACAGARVWKDSGQPGGCLVPQHAIDAPKKQIDDERTSVATYDYTPIPEAQWRKAISDAIRRAGQ